MKVLCLSVLSILVCSTAYVSSEPQIVEFGNCGRTDHNCTIEQVTVDPCLNYSDKKYCVVKRGKGHNSMLSLSFTPNFAGDVGDFEILAYTELNGIEQHFREMNKNACDFMTCPFAANVPTTYNYTLEVDKKNPPGVYVILWKMTLKGEFQCCFTNKIKLR